MKSNSTFFRLKLLLSLIVVLTISSGAFAQTKHTVNVSNNIYSPSNLTINTGDTVVWINQQGFHNVNGTKTTYPNNPESFGNSTAQGWTFSHVFNTAGTYNYQCDPHVSFGMVGKIEVTTTTGIESMISRMEQISVYPNPAKEKLYLSLANSENTDITLQIYNLSGTLLKNSTFLYSNSPVEMDISNLKKGAYFIRVESSGAAQKVKFIKN